MKAWHKRDFERQEFSKELVREIQNAEDELGKEGRLLFDFGLMSAILKYLQSELSGISINGKSFNDLAGRFFYDILLPRIERFSRVREEQNSLVMEIQKQLSNSLEFLVKVNLRRVEQQDPQTILRASSAMDEV